MADQIISEMKLDTVQLPLHKYWIFLSKHIKVTPLQSFYQPLLDQSAINQGQFELFPSIRSYGKDCDDDEEVEVESWKSKLALVNYKFLYSLFTEKAFKIKQNSESKT